MYSSTNLAFEAIDFQSGNLGKDIQEVFAEIRKNKFQSTRKELIQYGTRLSAIIKKHTNLATDIKVLDFVEEGFYVLTKYVNMNHVFRKDNYEKDTDFEGQTYDRELIDHIAEAYRRQNMVGKVDIRAGKVHGVFEEIPMEIFISEWHLDHYKFTDEEATAALLHEVGHIFTYFEYLYLLRTTNLALDALAVASKAPLTSREYLYGVFAEDFNVDKEAMKELSKMQDPTAAITFVLTDKFAKRDSIFSIQDYDKTSGEYAADVFCARHGYGRALVTGLQKYAYGTNESLVSCIVRNLYENLMTGGMFAAFGVSMTGVVATPIFVGSLILGMISRAVYHRGAERDYVYDDDKTRFMRIKEQLIAYLKTKPPGKENVLKAIEDIENIEKVIKETKNFPGLMVTLKEFIFKSKRDLRKFVELQRQLEKLGYNDLYKSAAKLDALL